MALLKSHNAPIHLEQIFDALLGPEDTDVRLGLLGKTFELLKNNIFVEILGTIMNHKNC